MYAVFSQRSGGKKVRILKRNPCVSFEMDTSHDLQLSETVAQHTYHYECVMGRGTVTFALIWKNGLPNSIER